MALKSPSQTVPVKAASLSWSLLTSILRTPKALWNCWPRLLPKGTQALCHRRPSLPTVKSFTNIPDVMTDRADSLHPMRSSRAATWCSLRTLSTKSRRYSLMIIRAISSSPPSSLKRAGSRCTPQHLHLQGEHERQQDRDKKAIEHIFSVKVLNVNTIRMIGKPKRLAATTASAPTGKKP